MYNPKDVVVTFQPAVMIDDGEYEYDNSYNYTPMPSSIDSGEVSRESDSIDTVNEKKALNKHVAIIGGLILIGTISLISGIMFMR